MKDDQGEKIWLDEFDELYSYHIPDWAHDNSVHLNNEILNAQKLNKPIPPITFAAHTLLNHLNSELEYEITRMKRRIKSESSGAAQYFRSTYPKYICWMFLCRATTSTAFPGHPYHGGARHYCRRSLAKACAAIFSDK